MSFSSVMHNARKILRETPAEVFVGAAVGVAIFVGTSAYHESVRTHSIPVGYSESVYLEQAARKSGQELGPMTLYLTTTNDATMDIFEAKNIAYRNAGSGSPETFARELEYKTDKNFKIGPKTLKERLDSLPQLADAALKELASFKGALDGVRSVNDFLKKSWVEYHTDIYRTETYTETETYTDADGKTHTETEIKTRQVYDHTNHEYIYHPAAGEAASASLDKLVEQYGKLQFQEQLPKTDKTSPDNEYAAEKSRDSNKRLSPEQLLDIANMWNEASSVVVNLPQSYSSIDFLKSDAPLWRTDKAKARSVSYSTYSHSDSGPREYQTAQRVLGHGRALEDALAGIIDPIEYTKTNAPILEDKIEQLIDVELNARSGGNGKSLAKEVLSYAQEIYSRNFKNGFDVKRFRIGMVFLFGAIGLLAGTVAGFVWNWAGDKFNWYGQENKRYRHYH